MNSPENASAAAAPGGPPPSSAEGILEPMMDDPSIDWPSTPWDEPARDWGPRRDDPLWGMRKAFERDRMLGTW
jgi:hypothetical protein